MNHESQQNHADQHAGIDEQYCQRKQMISGLWNEAGPQTYGILSSEDTMEFKTLSVAVRSARLEASSLLRTSSWDMACSGVTS